MQRRKVKCVVNKTKALLVPGKAAARDSPSMPASAEAEDKFDGGVDPPRACFEKLEARAKRPGAQGRLRVSDVPNDTAALEAKVDAFVADLVAGGRLRPSRQTSVRPARTQVRPTARRRRFLGCHVQGARQETSSVRPRVPPESQRQVRRRTGSCERVLREARGQGDKARRQASPDLSALSNDTAAVEAKIDAFVADIVATLSSCRTAAHAVGDAGGARDRPRLRQRCRSPALRSFEPGFACGAQLRVHELQLRMPVPGPLHGGCNQSEVDPR
jgi:hypothetical protein